MRPLCRLALLAAAVTLLTPALARATDGQGQVQTSVQRPPFPAGSTGYHSVDVNVVPA